MASTYLRWLIPGLVTVLGGAGLAAALTEAPLATDLETRASAALGEEYGWAHLAVDGRDVILSGTATTQQMIDEAATRIAAIRGVRAVSTETTLAEFVSPFPFSASLHDGTITLDGGYPNEAVHTALVAAAGTATDRTRMLSGGPEAGTFAAGAKFGLDALKQFDEGRVSLADTSLTISGRARSPEALETLATFRSKLPAGIQLAALEITPPLASPYIWTASYDGTTLTISGDTPSTELVTALLAAVPPSVATTTNLHLSSGEPSGFADNTLTLLRSLLLLEGGEARIVDAVATLSGAPATAAIADQVRTSIAAFGGTVSLAPPRIADYVFAVEKTGERMQFSGFVPDDQTRQRLSELPGADVSALALGRGAPDRFADGLNFGLAALSHLAQARLDIAAAKIRIVGSAATVAEFKAATDIVTAGAPEGMSLVRAELHPPVADPYVWSAVRAAGGATTLSGFVPDESVRAALHAKIPTLAGDTAEPGEGAPASFAASAEKGLEILNLLDSGTLEFDGTTWSIDGFVSDSTKSFVADSAFAAAGLRAAGWTYAIHLPKAPAPTALPIIAPYAWRAQKTLDGTMSFTGFAPAEAFQKVARGRVPGVLDNTVLGAGAPTDFGTSALAGIDALMRLDEGSLALAGSRWTLSGDVADLATRDAIQTALFAQIDAANWQVAIQARDAAPVVTPYLWSATKPADGALELGGYLPDAGLQAEASRLAGSVARDTSSIASGEPPGFAADLRAGLAALTHLREGRAMFDGSRWLLTGRADTQADGEAAVAALAAGSKGGTLWTVALNGYVAPLPPSASSSSELAVSSEPSSEPSQLPEPSSSASAALELSSASEAPTSSMMASSEVSSSETSSSVEPSVSSSAPAAPSSSSEPVGSSSPSAGLESSSSVPAPAVPVSSSEVPSSSLEVATSSSAEVFSSASSSEVSSGSSSSEPSMSSEPSSSAEPSSAAPQASSALSSAEPITPTSLEVTAPMPVNLVFEAVRASNSPIALKGRVPAEPAAVYFGVIAGRVPTDALVVGPGLPENFITNAIAGIDALTRLSEGRLGFDGTQWYLRGKAEDAALKDAITAAIDAVPMRGDWDVGITVLAPLDVCRNRVGQLEARNVILFQSGSAKLTADSAAPLDELAADLAICPDTDVHVEGHTDADGPDDVNLILSVARAEAVVAALVERGTAEDRLYAEGYGESEPVASNDTKQGKQQNRRIAFTIAPR